MQYVLKKENDILDKDISNLIRKLIGFLGLTEVQCSIDKYKNALRYAGPVFGEHYLKRLHPWWGTLLEYQQLEKSGKAIYKNATLEMFSMAADAKKISILQKGMPDNVRREFRARLLSDARARDYLYELDIAWHFHLRGHHISWYDEPEKQHAEFCVKTDDFEFDVECKRVNVDASRKIRRRDFYRLAESLLPNISKKGFMGRLEIVLDDRLHSDDKSILSLRDVILRSISENLKGTHVIAGGTVALDLETAQNQVIDFPKRREALMLKKQHNAHCVIYAKSYNGSPADPLEMICMCKGTERVLKDIRKKLSGASEQLKTSRPGLLTCYLEEIDDFTKLASDSGLQYMTYDLFKSSKRHHVAAVIYSSQDKMSVGINSIISYNQGLIFRNPNCKFPSVVGYKFLNE